MKTAGYCRNWHIFCCCAIWLRPSDRDAALLMDEMLSKLGERQMIVDVIANDN